MWHKLVDLDVELFLFLNSHHNAFWDKFMWFVSGKTEWIPLYILFLGFIIYRFKKQSLWIIFSIIILIALSDIFSAKIVKEGVQRLRPSHNPSLENIIHLVNNYRGGTYGFVSNHAANTFSLAVFLSLLFKRWPFTWFILIWASVVSYSRIYLGVHYPADVIGGATIGAFFAALIYFILIKWSPLNPVEPNNTSSKFPLI